MLTDPHDPPPTPGAGDHEARETIAAARREISRLCAGPGRTSASEHRGRDWTMSIPARPDDSDMVFAQLADLADTLAESLAARDAEVARLRADAERWRALLGSERVRLLGSARLGEPDAHIGIEFWGRFPLARAGLHGGINDANRADLTAYADGLRAESSMANSGPTGESSRVAPGGQIAPPDEGGLASPARVDRTAYFLDGDDSLPAAAPGAPPARTPEGRWVCTHCGHAEPREREVTCWKCERGQMVFRRISARTTEGP